MRLRSLICAFVLGVGGSCAAQEFHLEVIAFNDFHGNLESPGSFRANAQSPMVPVGGVDFLAGYIAHFKSLNPDNVVVSAGDLTGGSPLLSALFHEEDTIEAMNRLGLDINGVGNHEFDKGRQELLRLQNGGCSQLDGNTCKGAQAGTPVPFEGAKFRYLAANVYDTATGKTIFPGYLIKTYHGVGVAFVGLTLKDTPANSTVSAMRGLRFADEAETINSTVRQLRRQGIESFVVLLHQGGMQTKGAVDINGCEGGMNGYPIRDIVSRLDDAVDLVVSAHTHIAYICELPNSAGRRIPVTSASAFGRVLTQIDMTIDPKTRDVTAIKAQNILVDRTNPEIRPDSAIAALVSRYAAMARPIIDREVGSITAEIRKTANDAGESPMGDVIADAELEATSAPGAGGAVMASMNEAGVRTSLPFIPGPGGEAGGKITFGQLYAVQPFGNTLVTLTLTGAQIKTMLEEQFKGCGLGGEPGEEAPDQDRVLNVSHGFTYAYSRSAAPCRKIDPASIQLNGVTLSPAAKYRVTVNNFLADGGGDFHVFKQGTDRRVGPQDIDALTTYFASHRPVSPADPTRTRALP